MLDRFANIFKIPELRDRILFTLLILLVYRIGGHVPLAGINAPALWASSWTQNRTTLFGLYDMFVGGAFERATVFALGIMPYISASIIFQLDGRRLFRTSRSYRRKVKRAARKLRSSPATAPSSSAMQAGGVSVFSDQTRFAVGCRRAGGPGLGSMMLTDDHVWPQVPPS
jgi:preprotein translocase subunit SecY